MKAEVLSISARGFRILLDDREILVAFKLFPWFEEATVQEIFNLRRPSSSHLYWPDLDIDLAVESLDHPAKYPLVSTGARVKASKRSRPGLQKAPSKRPRATAPR